MAPPKSKSGSPLARLLKKLFGTHSSANSTRRLSTIPASASASAAASPSAKPTDSALDMPATEPFVAKVYKTAPPADGIYLSAVDQGTTSSRFIVFDTAGTIVAVHQIEFDQIHPHAGWTEHDPKVILDTVETCIEEVVKAMKAKGLDPAMIKSMGVTNQRETTCAWDATTGEPLCNAIVWHDTRPQSLVDALIAKAGGSKDAFADITGLPLNTYFSASKMRWMLDNVDAVKSAAAAGTLRFGTIDAWLLYNLSGGAANGGVYMTDFSNASRTLLMDLRDRTWSPKMLDFFGIDEAWLPKIMPSSYVYAHVHRGSLAGVPLSGNLGDQQAALVGQKCFAVGEAKNTYGTGCFMLFNTGTEVVPSKHGLLTTAGYDIPKLGAPTYALEGSVAVGGASVKFLRDSLHLIDDTPDVNTYAAQVAHTGGVYFVPAFSGLYAPYWRDDARGALVGMTTYTDRRHICRAVLESVGFQSYDVLNAMNLDSHKPLAVLKVDGGMTNSDLAMQLQADIAGIPVRRPAMRETTALGAAIAAALATETITLEQLEKVNAEGTEEFIPKVSQDNRDRRLRKWKKAVERTLDWVDADDVAAVEDEVIVEH